MRDRARRPVQRHTFRSATAARRYRDPTSHASRRTRELPRSAERAALVCRRPRAVARPGRSTSRARARARSGASGNNATTPLRRRAAWITNRYARATVDFAGFFAGGAGAGAGFSVLVVLTVLAVLALPLPLACAPLPLVLARFDGDAWSFSFSTSGVFSHVNPASSRPK